MASMRKQQVRVLSVGHVALDFLFYIDRFPQSQTKIAAHQMIQTVGGMSGNAAVAAARLGAKVQFAGPVGNDFAADLFETHFRREGVDYSRMVRISNATSSISTNMIDRHGERIIVNRRGDALTCAPEFEDTWLDQQNLLLADPRCPAWCERALRAAHQRGVLSILDGDIAPRDDLLRLVPLANWAVFSEAGLSLYAHQAPTVEAALRVALEAGAQVAAVTKGEKGVWWQRPGSPLQHFPAFSVQNVQDTTGAGDVFHAALGVGLAEGMQDRDAMAFACQAAALKCEQAGGILGAPSRALVLERLRIGLKLAL